MIHPNGCVITINFVEKKGNCLLKMINQKGAMHLMFIMDAEAEALKRDGYDELNDP